MARKLSRFAAAAVLALVIASPPALAAGAAHPSPVELDHVWIMVSPGAPERKALKNAGFLFAPGTNRHDGQGTASITVELDNAYVELMWPDSSVAVEPGLERAAEKFRERMLWRTSGWCPIGIGLRQTTEADDSLPFPTWSWTADWMPKGTSMVMLTPRDDTRSPALFIEPRALSGAAEQAARSAPFHHPIGCRRVTAVHLVGPRGYKPIAPLEYLQAEHVLGIRAGDQWLLELTLDGGSRRQTKDLRPSLPIVVRY